MEVREQQRQQRAEARAGRRSGAQEPTETSTDHADIKRALATAAAAAVVGGLAGALKAFSDRHGSTSDGDESEPRPQAQGEDDAPEAEAGKAHEQEPAVEHDDDAEEDDASVDEDDDESSQEPRHQPQQAEPVAAATGEVATVIDRAREHVEQVVGAEPEGVSGIERMNGNWCVNVEVVKLHRIPDSTDILASLAVVVDGDGDLVSLQETRRYRRSQAEEDR